SDTLVNISFTIDKSFVPGEGIGSSYYDLSVIDNSKPARAVVAVYDMAGNRTRIETAFAPESAVRSDCAGSLADEIRRNGIGILPVTPNPAAQSIHFSYGLHSAGLLDLSIYDILGNQVASVAHNEQHPAG